MYGRFARAQGAGFQNLLMQVGVHAASAILASLHARGLKYLTFEHLTIKAKARLAFLNAKSLVRLYANAAVIPQKYPIT